MAIKKKAPIYLIFSLVFILSFSPLVQGEEKASQEKKKKLYSLLVKWESRDLSKIVEVQRVLLNKRKDFLPAIVWALKNNPPRWKHLRPALVEISSHLYHPEAAPEIEKILARQLKAEFSYQIPLRSRLYLKALEALGRLRHRPSIPLLVKVLSKSHNHDVKLESLKALGKNLPLRLSKSTLHKLVKIFFGLPSERLREEWAQVVQSRQVEASHLPSSLSDPQKIYLLGYFTSPRSLDFIVEKIKKGWGKIRRAGLEALGRRRAYSHLSLLKKYLLYGSNRKVEKAAWKAIKEWKYGPVLPIVKKYIRQRNTRQKTEILEALLQWIGPEDKDLTTYFLRALASRRPGLELAALKALVIVNDSRATSAVFPHLYSSHGKLALEAATFLAQQGRKEAFRYLKKTLQNSKYPTSLKMRAAYELARQNRPKGRDYLFEKLENKPRQAPLAIDYLQKLHSPEVTRRAARLYGKKKKHLYRYLSLMGGKVLPRYLPLYRRALEESLPTAYLALEHLSLLPKLPRPSLVLKEVIPHLAHPITAPLARNLLLKWKDKSQPLLEENLKSKDPYLLSQIIPLLARIQPHPTFAHLQAVSRLAKSPEVMIRRAVVSLLEPREVPSHRRLLIKLLRDSSFAVRREAAAALARAGEYPLLFEALRDKNIAVRLKAFQALSEQKGNPFDLDPLDITDREVKKWKKWWQERD